MLETARVMENNIFWSSDHTFVQYLPRNTTLVNLTSHKKSYQGTMARSVSVSECEKRAHEQFVICKNIQNRDQGTSSHVHSHFTCYITLILHQHWNLWNTGNPLCIKPRKRSSHLKINVQIIGLCPVGQIHGQQRCNAHASGAVLLPKPFQS